MISVNRLKKWLMLASVFLSAEAVMAKTKNDFPITLISVCDSLPVDKATQAAIKEVPRSKKQVVPISVSPPVKTIKPIPVVKPKIIRPKIKIS